MGGGGSPSDQKTLDVWVELKVAASRYAHTSSPRNDRLQEICLF